MSNNCTTDRLALMPAYISIAWVAISFLAAAGCSNNSVKAEGDEAAKSEAKAVVVGARPAEVRTIEQTISGIGRCEAAPDKIAALTPAMEGQVIRHLAHLGQRVKRNDPIVELDSRIARANLAEKIATRDGLTASLKLLQAPPRPQELKQQELAVQQARLAAEKVQAAVDRLRPLLAKGEIPQVQVDDADAAAKQARMQEQAAQAQLEVMKVGPRPEAVEESRTHIATSDAQVDSAQAQLDQLTLRAPIDGAVDSLNCQLGQTIAAGTSVGEIVDTKQLIVTVWLPAGTTSRIAEGKNAYVEILSATPPSAGSQAAESDASDASAAPQGEIVGQVNFVGHVADSQTGNRPVQILVDNSQGQLAVGQMVSVRIVIDQKKGVLAVPVAALFDSGDGPSINLIRDGKSVRAVPTLGIRDKLWVEVTGADLKEPLKPGELVITEGTYNLPEGTAVETKSPATSAESSQAESQPRDEAK